MASKTDRAAVDEAARTIAPLVGPDDERVFTDSGIEIDRLYTEDDVAPGLEERLRRPRRAALPPRHPRGDVPRPARDDAPVRRLRHPRRHQRALPLPDRARLDRPL